VLITGGNWASFRTWIKDQRSNRIYIFSYPVRLKVKLQPDPYILQCLFEEGEAQEIQTNRLRLRGIRSSTVELFVFLEFCPMSVGDWSLMV